MTSLIKKLLESKEAKLDRAYDLAKRAIGDDPGFRQLDSTEIPRYGALITELNKGLPCSREQSFYKFRDRYLTAVQKVKGQSLLNDKPFGYVEAIIQIPDKRYYNSKPKPTLELVDPNLLIKCLENREKVLNQIVIKYELETPWKSDIKSDYLLRQPIGEYNYRKREELLDERKIIERTKNFIEALTEWAYNDPTA